MEPSVGARAPVGVVKRSPRAWLRAACLWWCVWCAALHPAGAEVDGSMADERASGASAGKTQAEFHRAEFAARGRERFNLSLADDEVR